MQSFDSDRLRWFVAWPKLVVLLASAALLFSACSRPSASSERQAVVAAAGNGFNGAEPSKQKGVAAMKRTYTKPSDDELRRRLSPLEFEVARHDATE